MTKEEAKRMGATHYEIDGRFIYYFRFDNISLHIWNAKKGGC